MLRAVVRLTVDADVLDLPGTPGDRLVPLYSGLLAGGVVRVGVASLVGQVASIRERGGRVEVGDVRTGAESVARGVSPARTLLVGVVSVLGKVLRMLGLVRAVGAATLARLDGIGELKIPVRLEPVGVERVPLVTVLRARGDTIAGETVRGEGDTVLVEGRGAGRAAGRGTLTGAVRVRDFGAVTVGRAGLLAGAGFWTRGEETTAREGARERDAGTAVLWSSLSVREGLPRLITAAGEKNRGKVRIPPERSTENPPTPAPLPAACAPDKDASKSEKVIIPIKNALICLSSCEPPLSNIPCEAAVRQLVSALSFV